MKHGNMHLLMGILVLLAFTQESICQDEELVCTKPTDLGILLDSTNAMSDSKWQDVLRFTKALVAAYNIGDRETKVSISTYGGLKPNLIFGFNTFKGANLTLANLKTQISGIPHAGNRQRPIDQALLFANKEMFSTNKGMRDNPAILKTLAVFVGGRSTRGVGQSIPLGQATTGLRLKAVDIYTIAIPNASDIDENELYTIASRQENVMTAKTYKESVVLAEEVSKMACGIKILEEIRHLKVPFPELSALLEEINIRYMFVVIHRYVWQLFLGKPKSHLKKRIAC